MSPKDVTLAALRHQIAALNETLKPFAEQPVDLSDPNWQSALKNAPAPLDQAGVRAAAEAALDSLLATYATGSAKVRASIRQLVASNSAFSWATHVPEPPTTEQAFRRHLLWLSATDHSGDFRDTLLSLNEFCNEARKAGVKMAPVLAEVAELSSDEAETAMGSLQSILRKMA